MREEGCRVRELPLGLCTTLPASELLLDADRLKWELGHSGSYSAQGPSDNGDMAICQKLVVPRGTALNKTKQCEEAATR